MKVVIDTNVIISGTFWSGTPYKILEAWRDSSISMVTSLEIIDEYTRVAKELSIQYPSIDTSRFIKLITTNCELYSPMKLIQQVSVDPDDDKFIECAIAANVKNIISGDKDLLDISGYNAIEVLKPKDFLTKYLF